MNDLGDSTLAVRVDTAGFAAEVATMRATLEGALGAGADRAGRSIESALLRAARTGSLGFDDLRKVALSALDAIARQALSAGLQSLGGGGAKGGGAGGGLLALATGLIGGLLGAPGRATGGPVAPGAAYRVGERGPELFVPTSSGRIETLGGGGARDIRITVNVAGSAADPQRMQASGRQIALAVKRAVEGV